MMALLLHPAPIHLRRPPIPRSRTVFRQLPLLGWAVAALLLVSCAAPRGLVPLEAPAVSALPDDAGPEGLAEAVARSIEYYQRLRPTEQFQYGSLNYSPEEMIRSHRLFLNLREQAADDEAFVRLLRERFHFFESVAADGVNRFTGYFEPVIPGREQAEPGLMTPLYPLPEDLVKIDLASFGESLPERTLVGRLEGRRVVPYYSRRDIQEHGRLDGSVTPLVFVNEVDLFFLQIQGSGIVELPDGRTLRVNYAAGNGHPYRSIGAELIARAELTREEVSLQTIRKFLADNPEEARPLLFTNPSYTFFSVVEEGPLGNILVPLTPGRSLALDHLLFPKGGLAYIETEARLAADPATPRPVRRFMVVQDTGGVIRGHGRADVFWGRGSDAEWTAGHMNNPGRLLLLVAKKEFLADPDDAPPPAAAQETARQ